MEPSNKIVMMKVSELSNHPVADLIPMLPEDHPKYKALVDSIGADGVQEPLICDPKGRVSNGRHRLRGARNFPSIEELPCIVKPEDQVATIAMQTALARRDFNESQRAIMIAVLFPKTAAERKAASLANLRNVGKGSKPLISSNTTECGNSVTIKEFSAQHDVGLAFMEYALRVMGQPTERRERAINDVMQRGIGLGRVVAGWGGKDAADAGKTKPIKNYGKLIGGAFLSLTRHGCGFNKIAKAGIAGAILRDAEKMPAKLPEPLVKAVMRGCKARIEALKEGAR